MLGAVAVYLFAVELMGCRLQWALVPVGLAFVIGLKSGFESLIDYWNNYGHG